MQPDELNLLEDGLQLWAVALCNAPRPEPQLLNLFPNLVAVLESSTGERPLPRVDGRYMILGIADQGVYARHSCKSAVSRKADKHAAFKHSTERAAQQQHTQAAVIEAGLGVSAGVVRIKKRACHAVNGLDD